jgi:hypothetical protein
LLNQICTKCGIPEDFCFCKKRKFKSDSDPGDGAATAKSLNTGESVNTIKGSQGRTRTGFWNIQNFTADLVQQGKFKVSDKIDSARNLTRLEFIADVIAGLGFESMIFLEMGSDAERFLTYMVALLNRRSPEKDGVWYYDISVDNGKIVQPPSTPFVADLTKWGSWSDRIWALDLILNFYTITSAELSAISPRAHLDIHLQFAEAQNRFLAFTSLLSYGDGDEHFTLTHNAIDEALMDDKAVEHKALYLLCTNPKTIRDLGPEHRTAVAHFLVVARAKVTLAPNGKAIDTDGPRHALRILGVLAGRYEKYGIVRRRHGERFLIHDLVETPLQAIGRPTNSRAAWEVNIPLEHTFFPVFVIHSMWTPSTVEDGADELADDSAAELRVMTLVAQAEAAKKAAHTFRLCPVLIAGDTNVDAKHVSGLNKRMADHGFVRMGALTQTTLRTEKTIKVLPPGDPTRFLSEPYDAVYFARSEYEDSFDCDVQYPDWTDDRMMAAYLHQLVNNAAVQQWYGELLATAYAPIVTRLDGRREPVGKAAVEKALAACKGEPKTMGDYVARMEALRNAKLPGAGKNDDLLRWVEAFLDLDALQPRMFLLFHRKFISDHRIVLIDVATKDYLGPKYTPSKGASLVDLSGSKALAGAVLPALDDGAPDFLTPSGGARVACLAQNRNTCGARAAFNCLSFAGLRDGSHAQLWAFAPALAPHGVFNVNHAIDINEDQVEDLLTTVGQAVNIPVVGQFLYYDAMSAGVLPANPGWTRIAAYRAQVAAFRGPHVLLPPAAPVLCLVLHTGAQEQVYRQVGVGHYFAVEIVAANPGYIFRYADSLSGAPDRSALIQAFIARYLQ